MGPARQRQDGSDRGPHGRRDTERMMAEAHTTPQHDYHLVDPSPWPAVGAISAFVLAVGVIARVHHSFAGAPILFAGGGRGGPLSPPAFVGRLVRAAGGRGAPPG